MMKLVRNILITAAMVIGLSVAAFAQKDGDKKPPPPKGTPPVITPSGPKPPPPKDTKPKKPGGEAVIVWREDEIAAS